MRKILYIMALFIAVSAVSVFCIFNVQANADTKRAAQITSVDGTVKIKKAGGEKTYPAVKGMGLVQGDSIITGSDGNVILDMDGDKEIRIGGSTQIVLSELVKNAGTMGSKTQMSLLSGKVLININKKLTTDSKFEIKTPTAVMGVRGTEFYVGYVNGKTVVNVVDGTVRTRSSSNGETRDVTKMNMAVVDSSTGEQKQIEVKPVNVKDLDLFVLQGIKDSGKVTDPEVQKQIDQQIQVKQEELKNNPQPQPQSYNPQGVIAYNDAEMQPVGDNGTAGNSQQQGQVGQGAADSQTTPQQTQQPVVVTQPQKDHDHGGQAVNDMSGMSLAASATASDPTSIELSINNARDYYGNLINGSKNIIIDTVNALGNSNKSNYSAAFSSGSGTIYISIPNNGGTVQLTATVDGITQSQSTSVQIPLPQPIDYSGMSVNYVYNQSDKVMNIKIENAKDFKGNKLNGDIGASATIHCIPIGGQEMDKDVAIDGQQLHFDNGVSSVEVTGVLYTYGKIISITFKVDGITHPYTQPYISKGNFNAEYIINTKDNIDVPGILLSNAIDYYGDKVSGTEVVLSYKDANNNIKTADLQTVLFREIAGSPDYINYLGISHLPDDTDIPGCAGYSIDVKNTGVTKELSDMSSAFANKYTFNANAVSGNVIKIEGAKMGVQDGQSGILINSDVRVQVICHYTTTPNVIVDTMVYDANANFSNGNATITCTQTLTGTPYITIRILGDGIWREMDAPGIN